MFSILATKSLQTSFLAGLLFYVFANPGMYKIIRQFPGLKFVMKGATDITHAGTMVHAVLFGLVMLLCVHLINSTLIKDHLKFLNVVEHGEWGWDPTATPVRAPRLRYPGASRSRHPAGQWTMPNAPMTPIVPFVPPHGGWDAGGGPARTHPHTGHGGLEPRPQGPQLRDDMP